MREIPVGAVADLTARLCIEANTVLPADLCARIERAAEGETSPLGRAILGDVKENFALARDMGLPICQDTGMAVIFLTMGQEVHLTGGSLREAIDAGVRKGYLEGALRCSVVRDPIRRGNTEDNTPAVLYVDVVPGDVFEMTVAPKGFGSENMSRIKMFTPAATQGDLEDFIVETVKEAGSNPCPPVVVGVGIGGTFEGCALAAKKGLTRPVSEPNPDPFYAEMEDRVLARLNELDVGPQGFGGSTTALAVLIEPRPTHIAGLPCAVNVGCHVTRHAAGKL